MLFKTFVALSFYFALVRGHGMMLDPVNRASRWRFNDSAPENYDDNELFCGGFGTQWSPGVGGKCGVCGDSWKLSRPRPHELGGKFGEGIVVKEFETGSEIVVGVKLTANHRGYFRFDLCKLDNGKEEDDKCFKHVLKTDQGGDKWYPTYESKLFEVGLELPDGLTCNHCVLRWTYRAENVWGNCGNGTSTLGCGPQEHFRNCADIRILPSARLFNIPDIEGTSTDETLSEDQGLPEDVPIEPLDSNHLDLETEQKID